jgi:hypothetical protein
MSTGRAALRSQASRDQGEGSVRRCPICGVSISGLRSDAVYCSPACRAEASRRRRLGEGRVVDGYRHLPSYIARQRRTKLRGGES